MAVILPDHVNPGDSGHVDDTNLIIDAVAALDLSTVDAAGDTMTGSLTLDSDFSGGENDTDSTSRITLESFQRWARTPSSGPLPNGEQAHFGELIRLDAMRNNAKAVIAWRIPESWDVNGDAVGALRSIAGLVAHDYPNNPQDTRHGHWSIEMPDKLGELQTRLEFRWLDLDDTFGMLNTLVRFVQSTVVINVDSAASLHIAGAPGASERPLYFSSDKDGKPEGRRFSISIDNTAETGTNAGSNFKINAHNDAGNITGVRVYINRSTGAVGFNTSTPAARVDAIDAGSRHAVRGELSTATAGNTMAAVAAYVGNVANRGMQVGLTGASPTSIWWGNGAFKVGNSNTAGRPTAAAVGIGGMWYDTTLSKPIWSDGTAWRDAVGTAV
jgi:hypothetical protein